MGLKRIRQSGTELQSVAGTPATLDANDYAGNPMDIEFEYEVDEYQNDVMRGTLAGQGVSKGARLLKVTEKHELVGGGASTNTRWHKELRGCGFQQAAIVAVEVADAAASDWRPGDRLGNNATEGSATKTAIFWRYVAGTPNQVEYLHRSGAAFADTDTLYNYNKSENTAVDSAPAAAGTADGQPTPCAPMASIPNLGTQPVLCFQIPCNLANYKPILTKLEVKFGNSVTPRPTVTDAALYNSGYLTPRITERRVVVSVDPEYEVTQLLNLIPKTVLGDTFAFDFKQGSPAHPNGMVVVWAPTAQMAGSVRFGERDGLVTHDTDLVLSGTDDDEIFIAHVFA